MTAPAQIVLPDEPPSAGAHRLAWWLALTPLNFRRLRLVAGMDYAFVERVLSGEATPVDGRAIGIAKATGGAVRPDDWKDPASGGWSTRPGERGL